MRVVPYLKLMRFDKPIGTLLLLWPTVIALRLTHADLRSVIIFVCGVVVMRAAGCVVNDYADRDFDRCVGRTKQRPIAAKQVQPKSALRLFAALLIVAFVLALQLNIYSFALSSVAASLAIIYPFTKRFSNYPQLVLGIAFAWSIPMVYAHVLGSIPQQAWLLFASTVCWVIAYDTMYAMADKDDDLLIGIKSTAITFASFDRQIILTLHLLALLGFILVGLNIYAAIVAVVLIIYQQWLIKNRDQQMCFKAFLNNNYFGMIIFLGYLI